MRLITLFLIFLLQITRLIAVNPEHYFRHYNNKQGLSNNTVYCILQDKRGFMWFGTDDGLNRFDGYSFQTFRHNSHQKGSLLNDRIVSLFEDSRGRIWICTFGGTCFYDYDTDHFEPLYLDTDKKQVSYFDQVCEDTESNLWFLVRNNIVRCNSQCQQSQSFKIEGHPLTSISISPENAIYVTSGNAIHRFNSQTDTFDSLFAIQDAIETENLYITTHYPLSASGILIGTEKQGLILYNTSDKQASTLIPDILVRDIQVYNNNEVWVATESGVYVYNLIHRTTQHYERSLINDYSIADNAVYCIRKDNEGGIWLGSFFGGLSYLPKRYTDFQYYIAGKTHKGLLGNAIREICPDQYGNLWLGTEDNGINRYNLQTGEIVNYSYNNPDHLLVATNIHGLHAWENELWIGTFNKGIEVLDIPSGKRVRYYTPKNTKGGLSSEFILCFLPVTEDQLLIGTANGVTLFDRKQNKFERWKSVNGLIRQLITDSSGNIWIASTNGLYFYHSKNDSLTNYVYENYSPLGSNSITSVFEDSKKQIWVTTTNGFTKFDLDIEKAQFFNTESGLPSNVVYRIIEDKQKRFWITTANGLSCFHPESYNFRNYSYAEGLHETQFNFSSSYQGHDGIIYMGTIHGMISFKPDLFQEDPFIPPLYISTSEKKIANELIRPYSSATFTLKCAALSYTSPEGIDYAYKLEGKDEDWITMNPNREVTFANLAPGHYNFCVRSTNSSGIWQDNIKTLAIHINPPFWATIWAYLLYCLLLLLLFYLLIKYKKRKLEYAHLQKQQLFEIKKEKELYDAKISFFTFITHEIRTPLTLIHAPLEKIIASNEGSESLKNKLQTIQKNTQRLLNLSNQLLDFKKTEHKVFKMNFVRTNLSEWINTLIQPYLLLFEKERKSFSYICTENSLWIDLDREAFTKILDNLITNAIKYSDHSIIIKLEFNDGFLILSVTNDGLLIPEEDRIHIFEPFYRVKETENKQGSGIGLSLARSLTEFHNGSLIYKPTDKNENEFTLTLPLQQEESFHINEENVKTQLTKRTMSDKKNMPAVLIVEDHNEMREFIVSELHNHYCMFEAANGKEAIELLKHQNIDLIISDIMMPLMDGFELCNQLKNELTFSHIPLILLTAQHNQQSRLKGLNRGADAYMEKPFSVEILLAQTENLLKNRARLYKLFAEKPLEPIQTLAASPIDNVFIEKLNLYLETQLKNETLSVDQISREMNMSTSSFYRKVKGISGISPVDFIKLYRLKKSVLLMKQGEDRINTIAFEVGFSSPAYFSTCFSKQYGKTPSEFIKDIRC